MRGKQSKKDTLFSSSLKKKKALEKYQYVWMLLKTQGGKSLWLDHRQFSYENRTGGNIDTDKLIAIVVVSQVDFPGKQTRWDGV